MKGIFICLFLLVGLALSQVQHMPSKAAIKDGSIALTDDITNTLCTGSWKEVGNWDTRGFGNELDFDLISENESYLSQIVTFMADGSYTRYRCEPNGTQKLAAYKTGKWVVANGWITMTDNSGDTNKSKLIKLNKQLLVFDLMARYRTAFVPVP